MHPSVNEIKKSYIDNEPEQMYSNQDFLAPEMSSMEQHSVSPQSELPRTCPMHPRQLVKYYCREDKTALCPECVHMHARHDFIQANADASREIKASLAQTMDGLSTSRSQYIELKQRIIKNQAEIIRMKEVELNKISDFFTSLKKALTAREEVFR